MRDSKLFRIIRLSFLLNKANSTKNRYKAISVFVSMFIFLSVAFYLDFSCATRVATYDKFQSNYIMISTNNLDRQKEIERLLAKETYFANIYSTGTGEVITGDGGVQMINCNVLFTDSPTMGIYYGKDDDSFSDYERYELLYGKSTFNKSDEVVISEEFASYISSGRAKDAIGEKVAITVDDHVNHYTVVGIYKQTLSESRGNKEYRGIIRRSKDVKVAGDEPEFLNFTIFLPKSAVNIESDSYFREYKTYVFAEDGTNILRIRTILDKKRIEGNEKLDFSYTAPSDARHTKKDLEAYLLFQKTVIMLVVMLISGINIFGTMAGAIAQRKSEIGIKKALGASDFDIGLGFFIENIISVAKAILLAAATVCILSILYALYQRQILFNDFRITIYPETIVLLLIYVLSCTLGFSLFPSYNASRINIVDTIRES